MRDGFKSAVKSRRMCRGAILRAPALAAVLLDSHPVLCQVYFLFDEHGVKRAKDVVRSQPVPGWLYYGKEDAGGFGRTVAQLLSAGPGDEHVLPQLFEASLVTVKRGGMMFVGTVSRFSGQRLRQAWWVVPGPAPGHAAHQNEETPGWPGLSDWS